MVNKMYDSNAIHIVQGVMPPKKFKELHEKARLGIATAEDYDQLPKRYVMTEPTKEREGVAHETQAI